MTWKLFNQKVTNLADFGYSKYLIVPFWYALAAYQAQYGYFSQTFAGVIQRNICTHAVFKETPTNYISVEKL